MCDHSIHRAFTKGIIRTNIDQSYIRAFSQSNLIVIFKNLQHNLQYPLISFTKEEQKKIKYSKTNFKKLNNRDINQRIALSVNKVLLKKQEN